MKKKNYWIRFSVLLVLIRFFSMVPVSAKWIINPSLGKDDTLNIGGITNDASKRVAYIEGDTDELGFTTIEAALAKATQKGGSQKVVVTANTTIKNDCVISKGVELRIPYDDSVITFSDPSLSDILDCGSSAPNQTKYKVNLKANRTINGTLTIMGKYGGTSNSFTSHSFGICSQRILSSNTNINVNSGGAIQCFGFIKEDLSGTTDYLSGNGSSINVYPGASVWEPLTIYDWPGGKKAAELAVNPFSHTVFPFEKFDRPNIYPPINLNYGSTLYGQIQITTSMGNINKKIPAIGSTGALINFTSGTMTWNFGRKTKSQDRAASRDNNLTKITVRGNGSLGSISVSLSIATINSSKYSIPRGPQFSVSVESGNFVVGNQSHWFGGNDLSIGEDGMVTLSADTAFFNDTKLINNGVLSISGAFGGTIVTAKKEATLALGKSNSISAYFLENGNVVKKDFSAKGYLANNADSVDEFTVNSIYESTLMSNKPNNGYWGKNDNLYLIRYNLNEHVTVSEKVTLEIGGQMAKKYGSSDSVTIIDPNDSEFKRSYTTTKVSGEGDNQTISVQEHTGYATFQGWNTSYYGDGQSITPGMPYSFTDLASKAGSHLIRLYDQWTSGLKITMKFTKPSAICAEKNEKTHNSDTNYRFDEVSGHMKDQTASLLNWYTIPECGYSIKEKKWVKRIWSEIDTLKKHKFKNWLVQSTNYNEKERVWLDESWISLCTTDASGNLILTFSGVFDKEAS